jgi:mono/diheme cytochrome c family protein
MPAKSVLTAAAFAVLLAAPAAALEANVNYALKCMGCHTPDGFSPERGRIPPLLDVVGYFTILPEGRRYVANVPGVVNSALSNEETAALLNWMVVTYARASMPETFEPFDAAEIAALRAEKVDDPMRLRAEVKALLAARGISLAAYP